MKWLLDLGNTRCKSAQWTAGYLAQPQAADCDLASVGRVLDQLAPAAMPLAIWISSVAGEAANAAVQAWCASRGWPAPLSVLETNWVFLVLETLLYWLQFIIQYINCQLSAIN